MDSMLTLEGIALFLGGAIAPFVIGLRRFLPFKMDDKVAVSFSALVSVAVAGVAKVVYSLVSSEPLVFDEGFLYADSVGVFAVSQIVFQFLKKKKAEVLGRNTSTQPH